MSGKVANVIAVELGILILLLAWFAFARFPSFHSPAAIEAQDGGDSPEALTTVAPLFKSRSAPVDDDNYSGTAAQIDPGEQQSAATAQVYTREVAAALYLDPTNDLLAADSPYYTAAEPDPALVQPDYFQPPVAQIIEYVQPVQTVIIANAGAGIRRWAGASLRPGRSCAVPRRHPPRGQQRPRIAQPRGGNAAAAGPAQRRNNHLRAGKPAQGVRVNWNR